MKRKIAVVTSSRADYSHLYWVLRDLSQHPNVIVSRHFRESLSNLVNPYGKGYSAAKIVRILTSLDLSEFLLVKKAPPIQPIADYEHSIC